MNRLVADGERRLRRAALEEAPEPPPEQPTEQSPPRGLFARFRWWRGERREAKRRRRETIPQTDGRTLF